MSDADGLVTFLRARLEEDEAEIAKHPVGEDYGVGGYSAETEAGYPASPYLRVAKTRALAEVEAKRRIIDACSAELSDTSGAPFASFLTPPWVLETLALPYADHPDYRPEWKP